MSATSTAHRRRPGAQFSASWLEDASTRPVGTVSARLAVNGCAFCIDMHWREARGRGEDRLYSLDAWRESPLCSDRERAPRAVRGVTLSRIHVPDEVWDGGAEFEPRDLAHLVFAITAINAGTGSSSAPAEPGTR